MSKPRITEQQKIFLEKNYPKYGGEFCSKELNIPAKQIQNFCSKRKIKILPQTLFKIRLTNIKLAHEKRKNKTFSDYKVNPEMFLNIKTPEVAYILGLLWSDGYIRHKKYHFRVEIEALESDLNQVKDLFLSTGQWNLQRRHRINRQPQLTICTNNNILYNFLYENDYGAKSNKSADKILSKIPEDLQCYWFRGLVDGDGCFYVNKNICQFSIASSYEQDWNFAESLLEKLKIKYTIKRSKQTQNGHLNGSSWIRVTRRTDIIKIINYIYKYRDDDKIGFLRKYEKAQLILQIVPKN